MHTNWKDKTCEKCEYRVEENCRRFPPTIKIDVEGILNHAYIQIRMGKYGYQRACAEYEELYER